jgi:hypothetical protein
VKLKRLDTTFIVYYPETPEGYLTVTVPITCPGVFLYQRLDGGIKMEAKLPEDAFRNLIIHSAKSKQEMEFNYVSPK